MLRWSLALATLLVVLPRGADLQELGLLRVRIVLADAEQRATPVSRYALLVSDNPASGAPRRLLTALDGTVDVRLRPGSYIVESDRPFGFEGKAYQWTQVVEIVAGRDTVLDLNAANAEIEESANPSTTTSAATTDDALSSILSRWQDSILVLWTPTARATGFLIDARGLIATTQRVVGKASTVEVQFTPNVKVAATVIVADAARDVAILRINPSRIASVRPIALACASPAKPPQIGQRIVALEAPLRQQKGTSAGELTRIQSQTLYADLGLSSGGVGGPVFAADGGVIGLTSIADARVSQAIEDVLIVRVGTICDALAAADKQVNEAAPPGDLLLPVEPLKTIPGEVLQEAATKRVGNLISYQTASIDFDVTFITPVLTYASQDRPRPLGQPGRGGARPVAVAPVLASPLLDFANWSEYVRDVLPVMLVRVTPKLVEPFWGRVARGAALSKGIPIPPIKRYRAGFERLRAFCGEKEVAPIHPFKLERRVSETDAIYEGLYVFDPDALSPECGTITLELFGEKSPDKGVTHVVEPHVIAQFWQDFAPYRALK